MAEFQPLRFLAACFLLVGWAQAQSCFPITGTKMCPSLDGLHVQRSNSSFDDVASFDAYVRSQLPQSSAYIREFQDFFQCSGYTGNFARYHLSVFCHFLVEKSGCVQPAPVTSLCQESCNSFITGAIQIFSNSTACDPEADIAVIEERNNYAFNSPFQTFCSELSSVQENPQCSKGEALESKWCGFATEEDAVNQCSGPLTEDACCLSFLSSRAADSLAPPNNLFIIVGISCGVGILLIVVFILYLRGKRWSSKATDSEIPAGGGAFRSSTDIRNKKMSVMQTIAAGTRSQQRKSRGETPDSDCISNEFIPAKAAAKKSSLSILAMTRPPSGPTPSSPLPKASKDAPLKMVVIDSYRAGLADELNLSVNDKIVCEEVFDDGWALGKNVTTGAIGAFPLSTCIPEDADRNSQRLNKIVRDRTSSYRISQK
ncbi:MAG: hypothetical protein SGCHY_002299 [Lobulomycetales sp.]